MGLDSNKKKLLYDNFLNVISQDLLIDEIGIILSQDVEDSLIQSSSLFFLEGHKLGIPSWTVLPLGSAAQKIIYSIYNVYEADSSLSQEQIITLSDATKILLLLHADHYTAWNIRKKLVEIEAINSIKELLFVTLVFTRHPKCGPGWVHRRWLLRYISSHQLVNSAKWEGLIASEVGVCQQMAEAYKSNYFAWSHRQTIIRQYVNTDSSLYMKELSVSRKWLQTHISDHSGAHYLEFLLERLLKNSHNHSHIDLKSQHCISSDSSLSLKFESLTTNTDEIDPPWLGSCAVCQLWHQEVQGSSECVQSYPGHETLWSYRRIVFYGWFRLLSDHSSGSTLVQDWISHDLSVLQACVDDEYVYGLEEQVRLVSLYKRWMHHRLLSDGNTFASRYEE